MTLDTKDLPSANALTYLASSLVKKKKLNSTSDQSRKLKPKIKKNVKQRKSHNRIDSKQKR